MKLYADVAIALFWTALPFVLAGLSGVVLFSAFDVRRAPRR